MGWDGTSRRVAAATNVPAGLHALHHSQQGSVHVLVAYLRGEKPPASLMQRLQADEVIGAELDGQLRPPNMPSCCQAA